jgi:hypothetical protein
MSSWLLVLPLITGVLGWIIHSIAANFFINHFQKIHAHQLLGDSQPNLVKAASKLAVEHLAASKDLEKKASDPETLKKLMPIIEAHIDHFLRNKLQTALPMIAMFVGEKTLQQLKTVFMSELEEIFPDVMKQYVNNLTNESDIEQQLVEKISKVPTARIRQGR